MITVIRNRFFKSNWYKLAIWALIIVLFIVFTIPTMLQKTSGAGLWVVRVNNQEVSQIDFARKVMEMENQIIMVRQQGGAYADALLKAMGLNVDPKILALEILVRESLMNQAAARLGARMSESYIIEKLNDVNFVKQELSDLVPPYVIGQNGINEAQLKLYLKQIKMSQDQFDVKVQEALMRHLLSECAMAAVYVPVFEARDTYALDAVGKKFSVLKFDFSKYLKKAQQTPVSEQDLQAFFDKQAQKGLYTVPEKRDVVVYTFEPSGYEALVTDQDIQEFYQAHQQDFVEVPAKLEVRRILFKVADGKDAQEVFKKAKEVHAQLVQNPSAFAQKATEFSQDENSASKGGLLPAFAKGSHEAAFDRAAFVLKNDGDISDVIKTGNGFEILQRVSKSLPVYKQAKAVHKQIHDQLLSQRFANQFATDVHALESKSATNQAELEKFIQSHKATMQSKPGIEQDSSKVSQAAFGLKNAGIVFYMDAGKGILVKVNKIAPEHVPSFGDFKNQAKEDFYTHKAQELMDKDIKQAQEEIASQSMQEVAKELGAEFVQTELLAKNNIGKVAVLRSQGLPVDAMFQMENTKKSKIHTRDDNGFLVRLDEVESINPESFGAKKASIIGALEQERRKTFGEGFIASLYRNATIKPNDSLFGESSMNQEQIIEEIES